MKTVLGWAAGIVAIVLVAWVAFHFFISTINPTQQVPSGHPGGSCWMCHLTSENANLIETD